MRELNFIEWLEDKGILREFLKLSLEARSKYVDLVRPLERARRVAEVSLDFPVEHHGFEDLWFYESLEFPDGDYYKWVDLGLEWRRECHETNQDGAPIVPGMNLDDDLAVALLLAELEDGND